MGFGLAEKYPERIFGGSSVDKGALGGHFQGLSVIFSRLHYAPKGHKKRFRHFRMFYWKLGGNIWLRDKPRSVIAFKSNYSVKEYTKRLWHFRAIWAAIGKRLKSSIPDLKKLKLTPPEKAQFFLPCPWKNPGARSLCNNEHGHEAGTGSYFICTYRCCAIHYTCTIVYKFILYISQTCKNAISEIFS